MKTPTTTLKLAGFIPYSPEVNRAIAAGNHPATLYAFYLPERERAPHNAQWITSEPVPNFEDADRWELDANDEVQVVVAHWNAETWQYEENKEAAPIIYVWPGSMRGGWRRKWFPRVGDGCCYSIGSDRYPYTVIEVSKSGKVLKIQADEFKIVGGDRQSERQRYEFTPNPNGRIMRVSLRKNGRWVPSGGDGSSNGYVSMGRAAYLDPSF